MGVYSNVHICVKADAPLRPDLRLLLVKMLMRHELLFGFCTFAVPKPRAPSPEDSFEFQCLAAYRGIEEGEFVDVQQCEVAGDWLPKRASVARAGFAVGSQHSKWEGEAFDGGFTYVASNSPFEVRIFDGYSDAFAKEPDGVLFGSFFDVLTLSSNLGLHELLLVDTELVADLRELTGREVLIATSWW